MLKKIIAFTIILVVGLSIFDLTENQFGPTFQSCINHNSASAVEAQILCSISLIDRHNGFFALIAAGFVAAFTGTLWHSTEKLWAAAGEQGEAMQQSLRLAATSASAMVSVAKSLEANQAQLRQTVEINRQIADRQKSLGEMQLRAYLSVVIGGALYQERDKNLRFEGSAILANQGQTPASRVVHRTKVAIFDVPLPENFQLPPLPVAATGENLIGPQQNRTLTAVLDDFVPDEEVESIKRGQRKGLYIWGKISYLDAFDQPRETEFCHLLTWRGDRIWGYFIPNKNTQT